jgi:hypothetical protein
MLQMIHFEPIDDINKHVLINSSEHVDNQFQERIDILDQINYIPETNLIMINWLFMMKRIMMNQ